MSLILHLLQYGLKDTSYLEQKATIVKKIAFFAIPIVAFAIADRTAIFWLNDDRRSRSDREKKIADRDRLCFGHTNQGERAL